jgi:hypothetical protein
VCWTSKCPSLTWADGLRGRPIVVAQNPAHSLTPANRPTGSSHGQTLDERVPDALVIPLSVIVVNEVPHQAPKVPLPHRYNAIEAFRLDRPDKALRVRVAVGRSGRCANHANANCSEQRLHGAAPLRIAIADQEPSSAEEGGIVTGVLGTHNLGLEAPPGFEPGMEVLQTVRGCRY